MNGHKIINQEEPHFVTFTVVGWIDVFTRMKYKQTIIDSIKYCQKYKGLILNGYVIMSNHVHMIIRAKKGYRLSNIIRDLKRFTSKEILKNIKLSNTESRREWMMRLFKYYAKFNTNNTNFQFWRKGNHPIELSNPIWINQKLNYIHQNPVKAAIVEIADEYIYSSASDYAGKKGIIEIEILDLGSDIGYINLG